VLRLDRFILPPLGASPVNLPQHRRVLPGTAWTQNSFRQNAWKPNLPERAWEAWAGYNPISQSLLPIANRG